MSDATKLEPIIRDVADVESVRGVCGFRRALVTAADTAVANVSHLEIDNSRNHYHKQMTEFYYVLKGSGEIVLDGERRPIKEGELVLIPPGVWHTSEGEMEVLIVGVPPLETEDVHFE
jgi:mannose-6-phosphate isomerase-like protein (cupin superfamily)